MHKSIVPIWGIVTVILMTIIVAIVMTPVIELALFVCIGIGWIIIGEAIMKNKIPSEMIENEQRQILQKVVEEVREQGRTVEIQIHDDHYSNSDRDILDLFDHENAKCGDLRVKTILDHNLNIVQINLYSPKNIEAIASKLM